MTTTTVKRGFKYRFYPTPEQASILSQTFGCVRVVYNAALNEHSKRYRDDNKTMNHSDMSKFLTELKKCDEYSWLNDVSSVPLQQTLRHLDRAYTNFFKNIAKYPRFKSKKKSRLSAEFTKSAFTFVNGELKLAKMKQPLDIVWSRELPKNGTPSTVTISRDRAGRWFVSMLCEDIIEHRPKMNTSIGIDVGLIDFAVFDNGTKISNPRYSRTLEEKLKKRQRVAAKKQLGSKNREKANRKVARIHAKIADQRRDFLHKLSTSIVHENQVIVIEDLAVSNMSRKGGTYKKGLNRNINDASWGKFRSLLEYKSQWYGRELITVDRFFPSSQLCSVCGNNDGKKPLNVRSWTCSNCGTNHDRDTNAARNIKAAGLAVLACGD